MTYSTNKAKGRPAAEPGTCPSAASRRGVHGIPEPCCAQRFCLLDLVFRVFKINLQTQNFLELVHHPQRGNRGMNSKRYSERHGLPSVSLQAPVMRWRTTVSNEMSLVGKLDWRQMNSERREALLISSPPGEEWRRANQSSPNTTAHRSPRESPMRTMAWSSSESNQNRSLTQHLFRNDESASRAPTSGPQSLWDISASTNG